MMTNIMEATHSQNHYEMKTISTFKDLHSVVFKFLSLNFINLRWTQKLVKQFFCRLQRHIQ